MPVWWGISTSRGTSTLRSRFARWCGKEARRVCRRALASSPTPTRLTRSSSVTTRRVRCSPLPRRRAGSLRWGRPEMPGAVFDRSPRGLVVVGGDDATSFLQSLISQDLDGIEGGQSRSSLLLTPQGKLDVVFRVTRVGEAWWLDTDADYGPRLAESLTRFRIRVKAEIEDRTATTGMLSFASEWDGDAQGLTVIPTRWGLDLLGELEVVKRVADAVDASSDFEAFRIEHGVPRLGVDINEKTIPQEAFL